MKFLQNFKEHKVIKYIILFIIDLTDNIFRAFINKDNEYIKSTLRKMFYIYSKQLKKKKLYYFMKLIIITTYLKNKNNKLQRYFLNKSTFNKLYNDYTFRDKKKLNMKINYLRNESELYPFSPKLDNKGFITFYNKTLNRNENEPSFNNFGRTFYNKDRIPLNQKYYSFFNRNCKNGRNKMDENESYNDNDRFQFFNDFSENNKNEEHKQYGDISINLKESPNKFLSNKKFMSSRLNKNINKQISEYLNNFDNAKNQMYLNNNYLNYERDSYKNKIKNSNLTFNSERFYQKNKNIKNVKKGNLFNKNNKKEIGYKNKTERLSFIKDRKSKLVFKTTNIGKIKNKNKKNDKIIYNDSQNYLNELTNKEKNGLSNKSLNPSSLGADQTKTFYTTHQRNSKNIKSSKGMLSNINSVSSRMNEPNTHFLTGLKMISGVNECFYDFNKDNDNKNYSNNHRDELSMQSLSDSKMMELANKYLTEDESSENYIMNNILHSKKKYKNKK